MASIVDICNLALSHLGNKASVVSISPADGSVEANYCARFYPIARDEITEMGDWTFARTRTTLALLSTNPSTLWDYAYQKPADCLVPRRIMTGDEEFKENDSKDFDMEGDTILTNRANAVMVYTRPVTDPTKFSASFISALSYKLAAYLAGPVLRGESASSAAASLHKVAKTAVNEAMATDANRAWQQGWYTPSMVAARSGSLMGSATDPNDLIYPQSGYAIS